MSKIDDLVDEYNKHCDNPYSPIDIRAGILAVVTAVAEWLDSIGKHTAAAELRAASEGEAT